MWLEQPVLSVERGFPMIQRLKQPHDKEGWTLRCVDRSWCQLRQFSEEQKDSFVFVGETEENKQEITLYPGGRKCIIDDSSKKIE